MEKIPITPETKIGVLLNSYPQLENLLLAMAPAFKKLRNPILRKTIAKIATLRQVAQVGEVSLSDLINTLRKEVGMQDKISLTESDAQDVNAAPHWFNKSDIAKTLDARPMLEAGEHPVNLVIKELKDLHSGQIYELITPFLPVPLIDTAKKQGYQVWSVKKENNIVRNYFTSRYE